MRLLDLFCCEGGASTGYARAGFEVFGVDLFGDYSQSRYPFPSHRGDALAYAMEHGREFDVIAASPPCQRHSAGTRAGKRDKYPDLIGPTRELLRQIGRPYVIENVVGAPMVEPVELCGCMFGMTAVDDDGTVLHLQRRRLFESNVRLSAPRDHDHEGITTWAGVYGGARRDRVEAKRVRHGGYVPPSKEVAGRLLGIDWMTWKGMHQAIPPAYTHWIGAQLMEHVQRQETLPDSWSAIASLEEAAARCRQSGLTTLDRLDYLTSLADVTEQARHDTVADCRRQGLSWAQIAGSLGVTKQAAQQRYGRKPTGPAPEREMTLEGL